MNASTIATWPFPSELSIGLDDSKQSDHLLCRGLAHLRALAVQMLSNIDTMGLKIHREEAIIEQLSHEISILKRHKFAKCSEWISSAQGNLLDDLLNADFEAIDAYVPLPPQFTRTVIRHEPESTECACGCQTQRIGEDVSEKLDYPLAYSRLSSMNVESGPALSAKY